MRVVILYIILFFKISVAAQSDQPAIKFYTMQDGLSQMKTTCMIQDSRGYMWIGTRNGLNRFNGQSITTFTEEDGLLHNRIHKIIEDDLGRLLILTFNGVSIYDGSKFINYPHPFNKVLYDIAFNKNELLILGERKLWIFRNGEYIAIPVKNSSVKFHLDRLDQRPYITFQDNKVYEVRGDTLVEKLTLPISTPFTFLIANDPIQIQTHGGINFYGINGNNLVHFASLENNRVKDHHYNTYWFFSNNALSFVDGYGKRQYLPSGVIRPNTVFSDKQLNSWISAENGFAKISANQFEHFPSDQLPYAWSVVEDRRKNIWFATYGNGLYKRSSAGTLERFPLPKGFHNFFASSFCSPDGTLYFANESGVVIIDDREIMSSINRYATFAVMPWDSLLLVGALGSVDIYKDRNLTDKISAKHGLHPNEYIQNLGYDNHHQLWAGSYSGVSRIDLNSLKVVRNYVESDGSLPMKSVFCSYLDDDENFWLGGDAGLMIYLPDEDRIIKVNSKVLDEPVKSIIQFDDDHLLLGGKSGLFILNTRSYVQHGKVQLKLLNHTNGYLGIEPGFTAFSKDREGGIWICSATSVDRIVPSELYLGDQSLGVNILSVNDSSLRFDHADTICHLLPGVDNITIRYEAIGSTRPKQTQYQVKLDNGLWSSWSSVDQSVFTGLSHGQHVIQVKAGPTDLPDQELQIDLLRLQVYLKLYQRAFFIPFLAGLLILASLSLLWILRRRYRDRKQLEATQLKAKYFQSQLLLSELNPHFIFNVLASIQHKILTDKKEKASEYIIKLSKLMRNFLDASHRSNHLDSTMQQEIDLSKEIELLESFIEFEHEKSNHHFDYRISFDTSLTEMGLTLPPLLIQPYVENAIKHGLLPDEKRGELLVSFEYLEECLMITVMDNGIGRKKALSKKGRQRRTSLGSSILEQRIALLNDLGYHITVTVKDNVPQGTIVELKIKDEDTESSHN